MSLHLGKTESILFGSNKRLAKRRELHITCNGNDIESGAKVTYLGVTLDQNLSGSSMITKIVSKCNNKIKFLYRNTKNLDKKNKMLLTSALVQCQFGLWLFNVVYWYDMSAQEEAPNYTKQSHSFYFRSSFQVAHWPN